MANLYPMEKMIEEFNQTMSQIGGSSSGMARNSQQPTGSGGLINEILTRFGLHSNPFSDTVNPEYFFRTEQHERAFFRMQVCASDHRALGMVCGPSGTGKTLLSQMLLRQLNTEQFLPLVILCTPGMTKTALLREILSELEEETESLRIHDLLWALHQRIMHEYQNGRRIVLLVDESHFLSADGLHMIRTLSNLETPEEKLITVILFAEDTLLRRLKHRSYSSLNGRIALRGELSPLSVRETEQMLKFRLLVSGSKATLFDPEVYPEIHKMTGGVPREICKLAYNALLEAHWLNRREIDLPLLRHCQDKGW